MKVCHLSSIIKSQNVLGMLLDFGLSSDSCSYKKGSYIYIYIYIYIYTYIKIKLRKLTHGFCFPTELFRKACCRTSLVRGLV